MPNPHPSGRIPAIEWITGALGLAITLALFGFIAWQALQPRETAPDVTVELVGVEPVSGGFVAAFTARNRTSQTAAGVDVEGTLRRNGAEPLTSTATLDYVPGNSETRGGLFFASDPRLGEFELRALGYSRP